MASTEGLPPIIASIVEKDFSCDGNWELSGDGGVSCDTRRHTQSYSQINKIMKKVLHELGRMDVSKDLTDEQRKRLLYRLRYKKEESLLGGEKKAIRAQSKYGKIKKKILKADDKLRGSYVDNMWVNQKWAIARMLDQLSDYKRWEKGISTTQDQPGTPGELTDEALVLAISQGYRYLAKVGLRRSGVSIKRATGYFITDYSRILDRLQVLERDFLRRRGEAIEDDNGQRVSELNDQLKEQVSVLRQDPVIQRTFRFLSHADFIEKSSDLCREIEGYYYPAAVLISENKELQGFLPDKPGRYFPDGLMATARTYVEYIDAAGTKEERNKRIATVKEKFSKRFHRRAIARLHLFTDDPAAARIASYRAATEAPSWTDEGVWEARTKNEESVNQLSDEELVDALFQGFLSARQDSGLAAFFKPRLDRLMKRVNEKLASDQEEPYPFRTRLMTYYWRARDKDPKGYLFEVDQNYFTSMVSLNPKPLVVTLLLEMTRFMKSNDEVDNPVACEVYLRTRAEHKTRQQALENTRKLCTQELDQKKINAWLQSYVAHKEIYKAVLYEVVKELTEEELKLFKERVQLLSDSFQGHWNDLFAPLLQPTTSALAPSALTLDESPLPDRSKERQAWLESMEGKEKKDFDTVLAKDLLDKLFAGISYWQIDNNNTGLEEGAEILLEAFFSRSHDHGGFLEQHFSGRPDDKVLARNLVEILSTQPDVQRPKLQEYLQKLLKLFPEPPSPLADATAPPL